MTLMIPMMNVDPPPSRQEDPGGVVDDRVDARRLHEDGEDEAHGQRPADPRLQQFAPGGALAGQAGADLLEFGVRALRSPDAGEDRQRLGRASDLDQVPGGLGRPEHEEKEGDGGNRPGDEHPPPIPVSGVAQDVVDAVGDQHPDHDRQLVERPHPAANVGRGHLRDVHRRQDGDPADRQAAQAAGDNENPEAAGGAGRDRGQHEQDGDPQQRGAPAEFVRQAAHHRRARDAAEEEGAERPAQLERVEREVLFDERARPGYDCGVEAEQQPAKGRRAAEK